MRPERHLSVVGLALLGGALLGGAAPASAQIGALAAAAAAAGAEGEYALAGAPVFSESGLVLNDGWAAGAFGVVQSTTFESGGFNGGDVELTSSTLAVSAFFAAGPRAMLGAVFNPYISAEATSGGLSESLSGAGNLTAFGRFALTSGGSSQLAATASIELPVGDEEVVSQTATVSVGLGASKQLDADLSIHGGASIGVTLDDSGTDFVDEGGTSFGFNGAVVKQVSPKAWLSGELLGSTFDGEYQVLLAPGARFRAGERLFIDVGLAIGALSSDAVEPIDYGLAIGATLIPGR